MELLTNYSALRTQHLALFMIVQTETIHFEGRTDGPQGHLVRPSDGLPHPGIVLIQEWWGIEPHIRELAQRLAVAGFVVMVPDLYHGQIATEPDDARKLVMMRQMPERLAEVETACEMLRNDAQVAPKKLGMMGFCMGGHVAFRAAEHYPHLGAISPWYGGGYDPTPEEVAQVNVPVLAIYGEDDGGIPVAQVRKVEALYKAAGKDAQFVIYPKAGHAFLNPSHGAYVEGPAQDAWAKAITFFKTHLV